MSAFFISDWKPLTLPLRFSPIKGQYGRDWDS